MIPYKFVVVTKIRKRINYKGKTVKDRVLLKQKKKKIKDHFIILYFHKFKCIILQDVVDI